MANNISHISYSASNTLQLCMKKYYLEKIVKQAPDADVTDDKEALQVGKAYHGVLEKTMHDSKRYEDRFLAEAISENGLSEHHKYIVFASLMSYYRLRRGSCLKCVACEIKIGDEFILGYVDAILMDSYGNWWICDLKTSGQIQEGMFARLAQDPQLNLYAYFVDKIAEQCGLNREQFLGTRYSVVGKSRCKIKPNETLVEFATRADVSCFEIEIERGDMDPGAAYDAIRKLHEKANNLTEFDLIPNRNSCLNYSTPCQFWSHCHNGKTYSECCESVVKFDTKSINDRSRIPILPAQLEEPYEDPFA